MAGSLLAAFLRSFCFPSSQAESFRFRGPDVQRSQEGSHELEIAATTKSLWAPHTGGSASKERVTVLNSTEELWWLYTM